MHRHVPNERVQNDDKLIEALRAEREHGKECAAAQAALMLAMERSVPAPRGRTCIEQVAPSQAAETCPERGRGTHAGPPMPS